MSEISQWSTTAASNNSAAPDGIADSTLISSVDDWGRETMASVRTLAEDAQWFDWGHTPLFLASTSTAAVTFTTTTGTDLTAEYATNRKLKLFGTIDGTLYGTIVSSSYTTLNTITVAMVETGGVPTSNLSRVYLGIITPQNNAIPANASASSVTVSGNVDVGGNLSVSGTVAVTGVADFSDGTASLPSITNTGDLNTGIFFSAADTLDVACGGARAASFTANQISIIDGNAGTPAIGNIGDTNTGIFFPAADSIATSTGGSEAHRTDSSQRTIHGHTASVAVAGIQGAIQSHSIANASSMVVARFSADAGATQLVFGKSRGALGTPGTTVVTGDDLGAISIAGDDGTDMATISSQILFECEGTIATNQIPGITRFFTANSSGSLMEWFHGDSSQNATFAGDLTFTGGATLTGALTLANGLLADAGVRTDGTNTLKTKVIDIGDWDMDAATNATVAHGLTYANIRTVDAYIRDDADTLRTAIAGTFANAAIAGRVSAGATNVALNRTASGQFDTTTFDATSYNRGWIVITYIA